MMALLMIQKSRSQPPGVYKTLQKMGYLPYQLVQDFFHQQYVWQMFKIFRV